MKRWTILSLLVLIPAAGAASALAAQATDLVLLESGYRVKLLDQCGADFRDFHPKGPPPQRSSIVDIECSPGGAWGDYVYTAVLGWFEGEQEGRVERVDFGGKANSIFLRPNLSGDPTYVDAMGFTPSGWRGGDFLLVSENSVHGFGLVAGVGSDPNAGTTFSFVGGFARQSAVDASGAFGSDLFSQQSASSFPGIPDRPAAIYRIDAGGNLTAFAEPHFGEMRFGPGGDWGTDLYVDGLTFAPGGASTAFATPFKEFAWVAAPGFDGDMFAYVAGEASNVIFRVKADGTRTPFASGVAGQLTSCNGALWIGYNQGCLVVTPRPGR